MNEHAKEVAAGQRFEFGRNWTRFLAGLDDRSTANAQRALASMLGTERLDGLHLLDIGSGSGLSSLVARRLGARVHSFDYDPQSVSCTRALRERFYPNDPDWTVEEGSVLDPDYLRALGKFDVVYSWGVLHHTGAMWTALENALIPLADDGRLFIAIYNHQLTWTRLYKRIKRYYVAAPRPGKWAILAAYATTTHLINLAKDLATRRSPLKRYRVEPGLRGMSAWYDLIDWVGGYPFETARPDEIFDFFGSHGLRLERMTTPGGPSCNEFVFQRQTTAAVLPQNRVAA